MDDDTPLDATLDVRREGADVRFAFAVRNPTTDPIDVRFRSGLEADVAVVPADAGADADDREVWRWSDGRVFTQALSTRTLAPGETTAYERVWSAPPAGRYEARATLAATPSARATAPVVVE
jgi:hypothetical protein